MSQRNSRMRGDEGHGFAIYEVASNKFANPKDFVNFIVNYATVVQQAALLL